MRTRKPRPGAASIEQVGSDCRFYFSDLDGITRFIQTQIGAKTLSSILKLAFNSGTCEEWHSKSLEAFIPLEQIMYRIPVSEHLWAEFARIDILIQRAVRRWQLAGQDQADAFRGLYVSDAEVDQLLQRPFGSNWGETVLLPEAEERLFQQAAENASARMSTVPQEGPDRLQNLVQAFGLDDFEKDILLICLAPAFDLRYEKIYGYLQDDVTRKRPGINLALNLLCPAGPDRLLALSHFAADAPLFKYHLLERFSEPGQNRSPLLSQSLLIDETIVHWLVGSYQPSGEIAPYVKLIFARVLAGSNLRIQQMAFMLTIYWTRTRSSFSPVPIGSHSKSRHSNCHRNQGSIC